MVFGGVAPVGRQHSQDHPLQKLGRYECRAMNVKLLATTTPTAGFSDLLT